MENVFMTEKIKLFIYLFKMSKKINAVFFKGDFILVGYYSTKLSINYGSIKFNIKNKKGYFPIWMIR